MKTEKPNKIRIELSEQDLEFIYSALNLLACHYSSKSTTMRKIHEHQGPDAVREAILHPDYYFQKWEEAGNIGHRIYMAQAKLNDRK